MPAVDMFDLIYTFARGEIEDLDGQIDGTSEQYEGPLVPVTSVSDIEFMIQHNEGAGHG